MIRFTCPTCKSVLQSPGHTAGSKVACSKCGQRLLVPNPVQPAAGNKTVLGALLPDSAGPPVPAAAPFSPPRSDVPDVIPVTVPNDESSSGKKSSVQMSIIAGALAVIAAVVVWWAVIEYVVGPAKYRAAQYNKYQRDSHYPGASIHEHSWWDHLSD